MSPDHPSELHITALGAQGDGVAETDAGPRYVAFALPGERVVAEPGEGLPRLLSPASPERVVPICRHFGVCGGCVAQHMGEELYAEWKREIVVEALRRRGLQSPVAPLQRVAVGTRRRAVLTARRAGNRVELGYHRRKSSDLVDIQECPVLLDAIAAGLPALRAIAAALPGPEVRLTVLATAMGLDVAAETGGRRTGRESVVALGQLARRHGLARVTVDGDPLIEGVRPAVRMGAATVAVPPGAFVQATQRSEEIMRGLVVAALADSSPHPKRVADLFCGVGTFTFELARRAPVLAVDSDGAALAALAAAAR
ncbi:MAG TPA: RNA methyltransferase, partial [Hyphomicrobiaceae bacterium]|nr:RNA methyltransferase [Hyphomicrobiaceae bacterium]